MVVPIFMAGTSSPLPDGSLLAWQQSKDYWLNSKYARRGNARTIVNCLQSLRSSGRRLNCCGRIHGARSEAASRLSMPEFTMGMRQCRRSKLSRRVSRLTEYRHKMPGSANAASTPMGVSDGDGCDWLLCGMGADCTPGF